MSETETEPSLEKETIRPVSDSDPVEDLKEAQAKGAAAAEGDDEGAEAMETDDEDSMAATQVIPSEGVEEEEEENGVDGSKSKVEGDKEKDVEKSSEKEEAEAEGDEEEEEEAGIRVVNMDSIHEKNDEEGDEEEDPPQEAVVGVKSKPGNGRVSDDVTDSSEVVTRKRAASLTAAGDCGPKPKLGRSTSNASVSCELGCGMT